MLVGEKYIATSTVVLMGVVNLNWWVWSVPNWRVKMPEAQSDPSPSQRTSSHIDGAATSNGNSSCVRKFTWKELSQLNQRHNAHVAYRGKVAS